MVCFVISGVFDCEDFVHVCHVADYLRRKFPNIEVRKVPMDAMDWGSWLQTINTKNNWHHKNSPLIYKELRGYGTHPHLIGGISEFWEYCWDYYGLESVLSKEEVEDLKKDYLQEREHSIVSSKSTYRNIVIYGPKNRFLWMLLAELFKIEGLPKANGIAFTFYNGTALGKREAREEEFASVILYLLNEYNAPAKWTETLTDVIIDCDLMIITEHFSKDVGKGFASEIVSMNRLADIVNHAKRMHLKILFANYGPACLPATILASKLKSPNVVVVTSDKGLGPLSELGRVLGLDIGKLSGPPVWGFVGTNKIVDLGSIIKKCNVYKSYNRAARSQGGSSLVQGTITTELRFINYLIDDVRDIWAEIRNTKEEMKDKLQRAAIYSKLSATVNVINLWFAQEKPDEIISLGVVSDGSYKIPVGMVFSQPAVLKNGTWVPFPDFPVSAETLKRVESAALEALTLLHS